MTAIEKAADALAKDPAMTDYHYWRALKNIETELYEAMSNGKPVPLDLIRRRTTLRLARERRERGAHTA